MSRPKGTPSLLANPRLLVSVGLAVLVGVYFIFDWWRVGANRTAAREALLTGAATELAKDEPDANVLSRLMADLKQLPDFDTAPEVLAPMAEIELVRGRPERAYDLFGVIAASPGASADQKRLGARILLARQQGFAGDPAAAAAMLQQVVTFAETAYRDSGAPADLLRGWQALKRLFAHERAAALAERLVGAHADSREARLVQVADSFDPASDENRVADVERDYLQPPPELAAMRTLLILQEGDVPRAIQQADAELLRAPGVPVVRFVAAIVYHTCALASASETAARADWVARRDAQLDWLVERAPVDEKQRSQWLAMRAVR